MSSTSAAHHGLLVGGRLVVTILGEVAEEEGVKPGDLVKVELRKMRKSYFGASRGIGPFSSEDEMKAHESGINPKDPIFHVRPHDWGKGTENPSREVDETLYG